MGKGGFRKQRTDGPSLLSRPVVVPRPKRSTSEGRERDRAEGRAVCDQKSVRTYLTGGGELQGEKRTLTRGTRRPQMR